VRVIPTLLLRKGGLVKTIRFKDQQYLGDPINTVRIFNEKEVDEIVVLDIDATREKRTPSMRIIEEIAGECFMPLAYGGGITRVEEIARILHAGAEKVVLNSALVTHPQTITEAARRFGSQSIVVSIDVRRTFLRGERAYTHGGTRATTMSPVAAATRAVDLGAGELLLTSIDRDGTSHGYDLDLIRTVAESVPVPVIACGGARNVDDFRLAILDARASAVAAGSMFVFQGVHKAVLISFPDITVLENQLFRPLAADLHV
jgi:imidazole glycerol-phosphate synthase subunit HisF